MYSSLEVKNSMTATKKSWKSKRVVIEFLPTEEETALSISRRVKHVYGDKAVDYSTVMRWVKRINDEQKN